MKQKTVSEILKELAHIDHCLELLKRRHSDEEVRRAAQIIGLEHMLPDPNRLQFDFKRAA